MLIITLFSFFLMLRGRQHEQNVFVIQYSYPYPLKKISDSKRLIKEKVLIKYTEDLINIYVRTFNGRNHERFLCTGFCAGPLPTVCNSQFIVENLSHGCSKKLRGSISTNFPNEFLLKNHNLMYYVSEYILNYVINTYKFIEFVLILLHSVFELYIYSYL